MPGNRGGTGTQNWEGGKPARASHCCGPTTRANSPEEPQNQSVGGGHRRGDHDLWLPFAIGQNTALSPVSHVQEQLPSKPYTSTKQDVCRASWGEMLSLSSVTPVAMATDKGGLWTLKVEHKKHPI